MKTVSRCSIRLPNLQIQMWKEQNRFNELFQPTGLQFAFLSKDNMMCHSWVLCRDFLNDTLRMFTLKKKETIYGFTYDYQTHPPIDLDNIRIAVRLKKTIRNKLNHKPSQKSIKDIVLDAIKIVNYIENKHNLPNSNLFKAKGSSHIYIFIGPKEWMSSSFMISLYTLLIRLGCLILETDVDSYLKKIYESKIIYGHDFKYVKTVYPFMDRIIEINKDLNFINEANAFMLNTNINTFHDHSGVYSLCTNMGLICKDLKNLRQFIFSGTE